MHHSLERHDSVSTQMPSTLRVPAPHAGSLLQEVAHLPTFQIDSNEPLDTRTLVAAAPDFHLEPEIPGLDSPPIGGTLPAEDPATAFGVSGVRLARKGETTFESLTGLPEAFVLAQRALADFVYSDAFRSVGVEGIPDGLVEALEAMHKKGSEVDQSILYEEEKQVLRELLGAIPNATTDPRLRALQQEAILELQDLVDDPFVCKGVWLRCQFKKPGEVSDDLLHQLKGNRAA